MSSNASLDKKSVAKNYTFLAIMLGAMVLGCIVGWFAPAVGTAIKPLGTVFINMMFCVVVPLVFASIAGSVANMQSRKRAGKIMGTTVTVFIVTGALAAAIMFVIMKVFPPVLAPWADLPTEALGEYASLSDMIVNFFTAPDFVGLLSRKAMLPL
ncbi:MAG: cation:dicarboxylase symporter family transporter, partial [Clostridia bacterium]|nr:cation:dicarboxylase symporter family transporter [Clostridia bacterium]